MNSSEKSKMNKQISIHHLYYVILIAGLILLFLILLFPHGVSRYAFDNFSFASTITSIVLAVVSIVYSIQSGNSSSDQLNGVRDIERNISSQLDSFSDLEGKLKKTIEDVQRGVSEVKEGQANVKNSLDSLLLQAQNPIGDQKGEQGKFIEYNSLIGNVLLYICALSYETKLPIPGKIILKINDNYSYCYGYLVALTVFEEDKIEIDQQVSTNPLLSVVIKYDEKTFGTKEELINKITADFANKGNVDDLKNLLHEVKSYFEKTKDDDVKQ